MVNQRTRKIQRFKMANNEFNLRFSLRIKRCYTLRFDSMFQHILISTKLDCHSHQFRHLKKKSVQYKQNYASQQLPL